MFKSLTIATMLMFCINGWALTPAEAEQAAQNAQRQLQLEQQRQQEQFSKDRSGSGSLTVLPLPQIAAPGAVAGVCRDIKKIQVQGNSLLRASVIDEITAKYINRCLGVTEIEALLADITRAYIEKAYIAVRVYLPPQDLSTGNLELIVLEGKLSRIEIDDGGKNSISLFNVVPFTVGKALNLRDFEQGLDQINRLSSNSATIEVLSGDQPGESVVVVHNRVSSPWHFNLSVDNQGSESTGKLQAGATISLDNPLRMNDFVSYTRRETIPANRDTQGSVSDSLSYVLPFGRSTLSANLNQSHYNSRINTAAGTSVQNSGESTNQTLRLDRVLYRDASTRWNMFAGFTAKESNSYLAGILLAGSRRLSVLDLGVSANTLLLGGALSVDLGMARGSQAFNALRDADGLLDSDPRAQFQKWVMSGSYSRPFELFGHELQFSSQWAAQYAEDVLYGSEQMLIGGIYTVRGFDKSSLSGDHGAYIRNEIGMRMPFSNGDLRGTVRPWIGLDCGVSGSRNTGVPEGTLTGLALGVQTSIGSAVSFDIFASKPLKLPDALARESTALWARLNINL